MSRSEWLLTGVLAIIVITVVSAFLLFAFEQRPVADASGESAPEVSPAELRGTAKSAYEVAAPTALSWAADAALLRARGNWPVGTSFEPERGSWSFLFYSPGQQEVALVVPDGDSARVASESAADQNFEPAGLQQWQADSPDVVERLLANGGHAFIQQYGEASLIVALNTMDQLVWTATLNATNANKLFRLQMDPATGQIVE